jgi:hypothetical protein
LSIDSQQTVDELDKLSIDSQRLVSGLHICLLNEMRTRGLRPWSRTVDRQTKILFVLTVKLGKVRSFVPVIANHTTKRLAFRFHYLLVSTDSLSICHCQAPSRKVGGEVLWGSRESQLQSWSGVLEFTGVVRVAKQVGHLFVSRQQEWDSGECRAISRTQQHP